MNNVADVIMTGEGGSSFGTSVSKAGNVNGDGYDDVIVGARSYSSSTGRAYIFQGGSSMNNVADVIMTGEASSNFFGWAVSTAGDVNVDGFTDVIVGSPGYSSGAFTGRSYLFYGGASMNNINDGTMTGEGLNHSFGRSVSAAGDLNYDGSPDLIVGASFYNSSTGRAYIYLSPQPTTPASALKFDGVNDYVSLPNQVVTLATLTTAITIEYWFKGASNQSAVRFQPVASNFIVAGWLGLHIISTDGGTANGIPVGAAATDGNWHHIAMTWQKNTVNGFKSYLDGNLVAQRNSANVNLPALNSGGFIGAYQGSQEFMNGSLDEVRIWQRALTQTEIQTFRNCEFTDGRQGLIAYYKFNHGISGGINTGNNLLGDYSGNFYYGTLSNFALTGTNSNWVSPGGVTNGANCGVMASGLNFDGVNDFVYLYGGLGAAVSGTTAITIEYWFKGTNNQSAVRFQEFTTNFIVAGWNGRHIISTDGGTTGIAQGAAATDGNWHHIAMTWENNTVNGFRSFLDGQIVEQRNSANVNLPPFTHVCVPVLGSFDGTQEYMSGTLDQVRIWNRALSQAEIQFRMFCETPSSATGLIANYHFNQGLADSNNASVTVLNDASGNSYDGQLFNFALNGNSSNWVNPGAVISGISCFAGLYAITAVPEGFYDSFSDLSQGDTIRVYLRSNTSPYGIQDSAKSKMDPYWLSAYFIFTKAGNGTYYLQLKHRNSLETWSKSGGEVYNIDVLNSYDFTTSSAQAFGNNMKQVDTSPLRFAIYGGDVNQDEDIL